MVEGCDTPPVQLWLCLHRQNRVSSITNRSNAVYWSTPHEVDLIYHSRADSGT